MDGENSRMQRKVSLYSGLKLDSPEPEYERDHLTGSLEVLFAILRSVP